MSWQDIGLTVGGLVFSLALIPTLVSGMKPPLITALLTGGLLLFYSAIYLSLGLTFAAASVAVNGAAWIAIAAQVWKYKAPSPDEERSWDTLFTEAEAERIRRERVMEDIADQMGG